MISFRLWCQRLAALATASGAPYPLNNGDYSSVKEHGLAYHLIPLKRRGVPSPWLSTTLFAQRETYVAQQQGNPAPVYTQVNPLLLIHWPNFLWAARFGSGSPVQGLAHELLRHLKPLVYQFDPALAFDIQQFEERYAKQLAEEMVSPLFFGQRDLSDEDRFNRHLYALLATKEFRRHLGETMLDTFSGYIASEAQNLIGLCPLTRHYRGQSCDACKGLRWQRRYVTLLWPHKLSDFQGPLRIDSPKTYDTERVSEWTEELRYWLSVNHPDEGIVRPESGGLLVNFVRVRELAQELKRPTPLLKESFYPWPANEWLQGYHTRVAVEQRYKELIERERPKLLGQLVDEAGWRWNDTTLDIPYELYNVDALVHRLVSGKEARSRLIQPKPRQARRRYQHRLGHLTYVDPEGMRHDVQVTQRKKRERYLNYYTLPYHTYETEAERKGLAVRIDGQLFWSFYAVNKHASPAPMEKFRLPKKFREQAGMQLGETDGERPPLYPQAVPFARWLAGIDPTLDKEKFEQLVYDAGYSVRLMALQRGERKHIGCYTALEDKTIIDFFSRRLGPGGMSVAEWTQLLIQLPGRSQVGVERRLEVLGFKYALENGYQAYRNSGWCLKHSKKRMRRWMKEGVREE